MQEPALWAALKDHPFPLEGRRPDLYRLILGPGGLGAGMTRAALREYRRFLYLAAIAGPEVAAPPMIAQIWRGHARDHRNYTVELMRDLFRRPMPHPFDPPVPLSHPAHQRTRALYRQEFGETPPRALWPGPVAMAFRHGLRWAILGFGGLTALLVLSREPAWAAVAALAALASLAAREWMTPWAFRQPERGIDLDFGADGQGGSALDPFYGD